VSLAIDLQFAGREFCAGSMGLKLLGYHQEERHFRRLGHLIFSIIALLSNMGGTMVSEAREEDRAHLKGLRTYI
jgi:hypothetical protein